MGPPVRPTVGHRFDQMIRTNGRNERTNERTDGRTNERGVGGMAEPPNPPHPAKDGWRMKLFRTPLSSLDSSFAIGLRHSTVLFQKSSYNLSFLHFGLQNRALGLKNRYVGLKIGF